MNEKTHPIVSVIVPIYKTEKYLESCIESILKQSFDNYEVILVDDGSPDNCPIICDKYVAKYDNFKVIHKKNGGLSSARNVGVDAAIGKYILFLDSDDTIETGLMENAVNQAEEYNAQITIFSINTRVCKNNESDSSSIRSQKFDYLSSREVVRQSFTRLCKNGLWNQVYDKLYLRSLLIDNKIYADSFYDKVCEDTVFLYDLIPFVEPILILGQPFYNYFIRENQSVVTTFIPERYEKYYGKFCKLFSLSTIISENEKFKCLLYDEYCTHILWAYEFMFHKDCSYSLLGRYKYLKKTFSIRRESDDFCNKAFDYYKTTNKYNCFSESSKKVLKCILRKNYFFAWLYHCAVLLKSSN